nr:MAG TPA_asm: Protein of unknown function (DUF2635) [Caudoviricetes sp.]
MRSINIYDILENRDEVQEGQLENYSMEQERLLNDYNEVLNTSLSLNGILPNGYRSFSVLTDKVYDMSVRVFGRQAHQVIQQELYQAFFKEQNRRENGIGALVTLCKQEDSISVKNILQEHFNMNFTKHNFDILRIIEEASDVRNAKFNVRIETVNSISMHGTRVNDTQYYARLLRNGDLRAVIVSFDTPSQSVTFRISVDGKILLYSELNESEILNLVEQLLDIENN